MFCFRPIFFKVPTDHLAHAVVPVVRGEFQCAPYVVLDMSGLPVDFPVQIADAWMAAQGLRAEAFAKEPDFVIEHC
ncbi:hypothetical protein B9Y82_04470 [Stenotrophomonas maltophilia]|nr:hypothetical protein B9Y82_04470 [Stenotrophomonas maltophilia]